MALRLFKDNKTDSQHENGEAITHTLKPIVTGSSVIGLYFNGGVIIATDTLCSYGTMAKFRNVQRIQGITNNCAIASSGEFSDFQELIRILNTKTQETFLNNDNVAFTPRDYGNYLARLCYHRRNKSNPYYLTNVVAGYQNGQRYLASVDLFGTYVENKFITSGFAGYLCKPIISNYWKEDCTEE